MIYNLIITIICAATIGCALLFELKRDLMMFQQNSYRPARYNRWLNTSGDTTSMWRLAALAILFFTLSTFSRPWMSMTICAGYAIALLSSLLSKKYKKPLVWTPRALRIFSVAVLLVLIIAAAIILLFFKGSLENAFYLAALSFTGCYCGSHIILLAAAFFLHPIEKYINLQYINDARRIINEMPDLKVIGITGSYGKTSTKHFLQHILSAQFDTVMTPGSFNTTLGVVRTIREQLKPYNEIFIVEMGAKAPGDIKEICDIVKPHIGILTAVGPQHLESFKTIERVQATKFELVDSLPSSGTAVLNNDFEKIKSRPVENCRSLRYGIEDQNAQYIAKDITYTSQGSSFRVIGPDGFSIDIKTRLLGEANISDLLAAIVTAHYLDMKDEKIAAAVASITPVEHRLSVKRSPAGITVIDDAFNSNPVGSKMALDVLASFNTGKRIVITPGMIELGPEQFELNLRFGQYIAKNADIAIIVGNYNRHAISEGLDPEAKSNNCKVHYVNSFDEAQKLLASIAVPGDTVLYENDLPDTFK